MKKRKRTLGYSPERLAQFLFAKGFTEWSRDSSGWRAFTWGRGYEGIRCGFRTSVRSRDSAANPPNIRFWLGSGAGQPARYATKQEFLAALVSILLTNE